jgi:hypothetical protein
LNIVKRNARTDRLTIWNHSLQVRFSTMYRVVQDNKKLAKREATQEYRTG